ncbi:hypothetical protein GGX14DRAFT_546490 [Mycena pura]|uniref:CCHC-type domain-containing protein n=1 Tax=Mycena pura TaxID=153505 RepID=A0AAD6UQ58_9AGAR|nr:hypothetical protein GGX14DRAFT_546490 [Mycena pura]
MSDHSSSHRVAIDPLRGADNYPVWKIKMLDILTDLSLDDYIDANLVRLREQTPATTALPVTDKSKVKCYECGILGHFASDHRKNAPNKNQVDSGHANGQGKSKQQDRKQKGKFKSRAHMARDDESDGDDDFLFLARDPNLVQSLSPDDWLLDSGCSRTIVRKNTDFSTYSGTPPHKIAGIGETAAIGRAPYSKVKQLNCAPAKARYWQLVTKFLACIGYVWRRRVRRRIAC